VSYDEDFDLVISTGVIHHNADPSRVLKRLTAALKRNGVMELMIYNFYHRLLTTAYQKAIRLMCNQGETIDVDKEMPITLSLIEHFPIDNMMGEYLKTFRNAPEAMTADNLLQPVERSYTVESMSHLAQSCGLELLTFCSNHFDASVGNRSWNIDFDNPLVEEQYNRLPDLVRWQVGHLLLVDKSPMTWFYVQRTDSDHPRRSEHEINTSMCEQVFAKYKTSYKNYVYSADGVYEPDPTVIPHPSPPFPTDPLARKVFKAVNGKMKMGEILDRLGIEPEFKTLDRIRTNLATAMCPYIEALI